MTAAVSPDWIRVDCPECGLPVTLTTFGAPGVDDRQVYASVGRRMTGVTVPPLVIIGMRLHLNRGCAAR